MSTSKERSGKDNASLCPLTPDERQEDFDAAERAHLEHFAPSTERERVAVRDIAVYDWLVERFQRLQTELLLREEIDEKGLIRLLRYQNAYEICRQKAVAAYVEGRRRAKSEAGKANRSDGNPWFHPSFKAEDCGWADPLTGEFRPLQEPDANPETES